MTAQIINAAPMVIQYGTQDLSTVQLPREPEAIPQHLPKFYLYCQKGPSTPQLVGGAEMVNMYGIDTFDLRKPYANHATVFANLVNAEGNNLMIERIIPDDAGPEANITFWLDVLPTKVTAYQRNIDGSFKLDVGGNPIPDTTLGTAGEVDGYKIKWIVTHDSTDLALQGFGQRTIKAGTQTDAATTTVSQQYPIFELKVSSKGAYGNNRGIRIWAPTTKTTLNMPTKLIDQRRTFPYFISMINRPNAKTTAQITETIFAEQYAMVVLKPQTIDPLTDAQVYIGDNIIDKYQNVDDPRYPAVYGDFGSFAIYNDNIAAVSALFLAAEIPYINQWSDITTSPLDLYLMNFVSGVSTVGVPYTSMRFVDDNDSTRLTAYTNLWADGASDGTMTDEAFGLSVITAVNRYLDPNDVLQEVAVNVESIIYDSGFPLDTKYALISFISQRKDTFLILSTHDVNDRILQASEEHSLAIALRTHLQMYPESDYFGTPVMRGMIIGRSAKLRNSQYTKRLPLSAEIAIKSARYMGAGFGRWKNGYHFDGAPGSVIDYMYDISITWVPNSVRNRNWDVGLNWVQSYDRRNFFFPALKTIYSDDTSVLNSYFTAMAICYLNKVAHAAWREFTGEAYLTNAQLAQRVNDFVTSRVKDRFDGRYVVVPDTFFTDMDVLRGFSWTLPIKIFAPNMKTVMTTYVQAYRISSAPGQTNP